MVRNRKLKMGCFRAPFFVDLMSGLANHNKLPVDSRRHPLLVFVSSFHSKSVKARYLVPVLLLFLAFPANDVLAQDSTLTKVQEKMQELDFWIGKWQQKGTWLPSGGDVGATVECSWILDDTYIECTVDPGNDAGSFLEIYSYNEVSDKYFIDYYIPEFGHSRDEFIRTEEGWSSQGQTTYTFGVFWEQMIFTPENDNTIQMVQYRSRKGSAPEKVQEATFSRID